MSDKSYLTGAKPTCEMVLKKIVFINPSVVEASDRSRSQPLIRKVSKINGDE